jgi:hypothetical protein
MSAPVGLIRFGERLQGMSNQTSHIGCVVAEPGADQSRFGLQYFRLFMKCDCPTKWCLDLARTTFIRFRSCDNGLIFS